MYLLKSMLHQEGRSSKDVFLRACFSGSWLSAEASNLAKALLMCSRRMSKTRFKPRTIKPTPVHAQDSFCVDGMRDRSACLA